MRIFTTAMSVAMVLIGIAMLGQALSGGGGPLALGVVLGVLFIAAGAGRLWLQRGSRS